MYRLAIIWTALRASFWFVPYLIVSAFGVLAVVLTALSPATAQGWIRAAPQLFNVGTDGAADILSTIASSMMSIVGIVFSLTLVALTLASSQYSSRVLRTFMRNRLTQASIGVFAGLFVYCLIVLRQIRGEGDQSVTAIAVSVALAAAVGAVVLLIFFIHHIAVSIQASNVLANIARETIATIEGMYPIGGDRPSCEDKQGTAPDGRQVLATTNGYIQSIDETALLRFADRHSVRIDLQRGVGQFVMAETCLLVLSDAGVLARHDLHELRAMISISDERTIAQDPAFGIRQIVDVALKALSPALNDTTTAVMGLDYLGAILAALGPRAFPSPCQRVDGIIRLVTVQPDFTVLVREAFDQIRRSADGNVAIILRIATTLEHLGTLALPADRYHALFEQLDFLTEFSTRTVPAPADRVDIDNQLDKVLRSLVAQRATAT